MDDKIIPFPDPRKARASRNLRAKVTVRSNEYREEWERIASEQRKHETLTDRANRILGERGPICRLWNGKRPGDDGGPEAA